MVILGVNAFHGDAAACLLVEGEVVAAVEEERFTRLKHQAGFPEHAVRWCLASHGLALRDVDRVAVGRDPRAHLGAKLAWAARRPASRFVRDRLANRRRLRAVDALVAEACEATVAPPVGQVEHHRAHLASAFFCSPFEEATVVSLDGFGDFVSAMWGRGRGGSLEVEGQVLFPHSLGVLYTALTQYLGFHHYGDEYKVMGLAAYGEPEQAEALRRLVLRDGDGFRLDGRYFRHFREGVAMSWGAGAPELGPLWTGELERLLGPARAEGEPVGRRHEAVAASLQRVLEEQVFALLRRLQERHGLDALCLAGGVALNAVANGKLRRETPFRELYVQPAAHDAGTAIGAALHVWHELGGERRWSMEHAYLGPAASEADVARALHGAGVAHERVGAEAAADRAAEAIVAGKIVGWYQGAAEFGPRALGNRSLLADPRRAGMKELLNERIKRREPFRPFAPSVLEEAAGEWFEGCGSSPFMTVTYPVRAARRDAIPAPTHVDGSARVQTVSRETNPLYHRLVGRVGELTGVPVVLNTSFNENEPIVNTPAEAVETFLRTRMDLLAIGPFVAERP